MNAKRKKYVTPPSIYQEIAAKFNTCEVYVGQINRGDRQPVRGKGLAIKKELEKYNKQQNKNYEKAH